MKPFTERDLRARHLIPEPEASTQSVYHSLDSVVQAVLTDAERQHRRSCSRTANSTAQGLISQGK